MKFGWSWSFRYGVFGYYVHRIEPIAYFYILFNRFSFERILPE